MNYDLESPDLAPEIMELQQRSADTSVPTVPVGSTGAVLPVSQGGTGANTAASARSNLGAAAAGANSDVTSLDAALSITNLVALTLAADTPAQITADQNNYALAAKVVQRLSTDASRTVTGLTCTSKVIIIFNVGANDLVLANESGSSSAANRIITGTAANLTLAAAGRALLVYDAASSRWRVVTP